MHYSLRVRALAFAALVALAAPAFADKFEVPKTDRHVIDFDPGWRFIKADVKGAEAPGFDDAKWELVSTPHTYNDLDTFDEIITRAGEKSEYMGPAWYRRSFVLPDNLPGGERVVLEFEGMRNTGQIFLNGKQVSLYQNGVTEHGVDLTDAVNRTGPNVLAVRVDNSHDWIEQPSGTSFEWASRDFDSSYGGINKHVHLHLLPAVHQTLAIDDGLKTTGVYVYATDFDVKAKTARIGVEAQIKNDASEQQSIDFKAIVVDGDGNVAGTFTGETYDAVNGESGTLTATGTLNNAHLWSPADPYLYDVFTTLSVDGKVVDVVKTTTGFRKAEFRGGAGTGGVYINDAFTFLTGYAQRSTNEWAGLGAAYPDWMHDFTAQLIRDSHANYIRWMHVAPNPADVHACDRAGIVQIVPAGDKEKDVEGRQWEQRVEAMRATILSYRNDPSVLFWEAGNNSITPAHMKQMQDLAHELDPHGGRAMGCRSLADDDAVASAGYLGVMVASDQQKDQRKTPTDVFRAYSEVRRDKLPIIEVEDFRDEAARRFWDKFSPPSFGFHKKPDDTWDYDQESYCVAAAKRYDEYLSNLITNTDPQHSRWAGYASIIFADTNSHGRQYGSEVCRVSGKVDAVRLPKESYRTYTVIQNPKPDVQILGHWNYPAGTKKTVYVISNCNGVELQVNGKTIATNTKPDGGFVFAFPDIEWSAGSIKAIATRKGQPPVTEEIQTVGPAKRLKLTPIAGPGGFHADGADVALFDVEVVDEQGRRCPTDEARVDFDVSGPVVWRGGYNSGIAGSTNNRYLNTECGINRVAVRATLTPGTLKLTARRDGLESASIDVPIAAKPGVPTTQP